MDGHKVGAVERVSTCSTNLDGSNGRTNGQFEQWANCLLVLRSWMAVTDGRSDGRTVGAAESVFALKMVLRTWTAVTPPTSSRRSANSAS